MRTPNSAAFTNGLAFAKVPPPTLPSLSSTTSSRVSAKSAIRLGAKTLTFRVGTDTPRDFVVHESLIVHRSDFVNLALSNDWKEARERLIPLPDDLPETFELYQQWLYSKVIASNHFGDAQLDGKEYAVLVQAYCLGEKLVDSHFKDAVIDAIIEKLRTTSVFDPRLTSSVYDNTPPESPLRRLWQHVYVWSGNPDWLDESTLGDFVNAEFALDLSRYHMAINRGQGPASAPFVDSTCVYHEHVGGACYRGVNRL